MRLFPFPLVALGVAWGQQQDAAALYTLPVGTSPCAGAEPLLPTGLFDGLCFVAEVNGDMRSIAITHGSDPHDLAKSFCEKHLLGREEQDILAGE